MPSPFPGMDPYLEKPSFWPDVHHELISGIRATLTKQLHPRYQVRIEKRVYLSGPQDPGRGAWIPDLYLIGASKRKPSTPAARSTTAMEVAEPVLAITLVNEDIFESYLEVLDTSDRSVVCVIEVLSPSNKIDGAAGLESFREKRNQVMRSSAHWVEIDLLRMGVSLTPEGKIPDHEYLVHVSPVERRPKGVLWFIRLSQRLPVIGIPLRPRDGETPLDLQVVLDTAYDRGGYDTESDYKKEPVPPLSKEWKTWADQLLRERTAAVEKSREMIPSDQLLATRERRWSPDVASGNAVPNPAVPIEELTTHSR